MAEGLVQKVLNGDVPPMQAYVQMRAIAEVCDQFLKNADITALVQGECATLGKEAGWGGAKVGVSNTTRMDYTTAGDPEYARLLKEKESVADRLKAREMFLKSITDDLTTIDPSTGEVVTIHPCQSKVTQAIRVTFAKS